MPDDNIQRWLYCPYCEGKDIGYEVYSDGSITVSCRCCGREQTHSLKPVRVA